MDTILIGIAGGTGSGKTTLTKHLKKRFGDDITVIGHDSYYKRQNRPFEERCRQNYDHPDAFDTDLLVQHLKALKRGETIQCPVYSYVEHNRTDETVEIKPTKVILVEGDFDLCQPGAAGYAGYQDLCGDGCGCAHPPPLPARCGGAGSNAGECGHPVSDHCQAHDGAVCGAFPEVRRYCGTGRRIIWWLLT